LSPASWNGFFLVQAHVTPAFRQFRCQTDNCIL
jgi:hypothetical protein